jgi:polyol permease family
VVSSIPADAGRRPVIDRLGMYPPLVLGYVGLLFFMVGDGVEAGFLSPYLIDRGLTKEQVALVFTVYGVTVAISAWLSGALSDLLGPRQVMGLGLGIWVAFEVGFLLLGVPPGDGPVSFLPVVGLYALRGFGYPLFAYGFLVWITVATPRRRLGTAVGWFWFALTGGLLNLGPLVARWAIPVIGAYQTLWCSLGLVVLGGLIALVGVREPTGMRRLAPPGEAPIRTLFASISIAWEKPKTAVGCIVRVINTAPQNGFLVFLPLYFQAVGFKLAEWLEILSFMFLSNIVWNLLFGVIGDRFGWRRTVALCGGVGSAATTLLLYYVPATYGANYPLAVLAAVLYGATLAGYVPLSALMPSLAPENKGAAMSLLNLGAGASNWVGPAIFAVIAGVIPQQAQVGVTMWTYAVLYLVSAALAAFLTLPPDHHTARGPAPEAA